MRKRMMNVAAGLAVIGGLAMATVGSAANMSDMQQGARDMGSQYLESMTGSGASGMNQGMRSMSGKVGRMGAGYILMTNQGQHYILDTSQADVDMSRYVDRQVTVSGSMATTDIPASGTAGAERANTIVVHEVKEKKK